MTRNRRPVLLVLAMVLTLVLSACSGGAETGTPPATGETAGSSDTPAGDGAQLLYTYWGSAFEKDAQAAAVAEFERQNPDIAVEALHIPSSGTEYVAKLTAMTASGTNPDIGYMDTATAFVWAKEDKFYDIFELIEQDPNWEKDRYVDDIFYMYDVGKSFGTTSSINPRAVFYNTECFADAGVDLPPTAPADAWTWEEFVETAKALTLDVQGRNALDPAFDSARISQYGIYLNPNDMVILSIFMDSNSADLLSEDGGALALDTPEAKEVIQAMHDLIYVHHVCPIPNDFSNMPDGPTWLSNKQAAMFITGQWVLLDIAKLDFDYGIGQLPRFQELRNVKDAGVRVIFSNTQYPAEAWELYKFLANPAGAMDLYRDGLWMPTLREWYEDEGLYAQWGKDNPAHPESYTPVVADSLFNGIATPSWVLRVSNYAELNSVIPPLLQQVWLDSKDVDAAIQEVYDAASGLVQGYNPDNYHNSRYRK